MGRPISWKEAEKIKAADTGEVANSPERELLRDLLKLAIKDLCSGELPVRRLARWWIYEDDSRKVDSKAGYISFRGACEALGLDPASLREKLRAIDGNRGSSKTRSSSSSAHLNRQGRMVRRA